MPSHKTFIIKKKLGKKMRQNRPIPGWIRLRTDNKISSLFILHAGTTLSVGIGAVPSSGSRSSDLAAMTLIRSKNLLYNVRSNHGNEFVRRHEFVESLFSLLSSLFSLLSSLMIGRKSRKTRNRCERSRKTRNRCESGLFTERKNWKKKVILNGLFFLNYLWAFCLSDFESLVMDYVFI
ncbi:hypothetical protein YC2023_063494 [Brassica napus]